MFVSTRPAPLPVVQATPEPRVAAAQPVKAPNFANLLRQNRAAQAPAPAHPPATGSPAAPFAEANDSAPVSADDSTLAVAPNAAQRARTAAADKAPRPASKSPAKAEADDSEADATDPAKQTGDTPAPGSAHPLPAHWMSHLNRPAELPTEALARGTSASTESTAATQDDSANGQSTLALPTGATNAGTEPADAAQAQLAASSDAFTQRLEAAAFGAGNAAEASHGQAAPAAQADANSGTLPTPAGFTATAGMAAMRAAEPTAVAIATPVTAPDFSQVLGVQLSVLAKDGIQHAELHLNPADMGPVSVQIEMNGNQAHIDFGADMAATRQAIEAGLPELASALRDAGFTLSGGGVSQHSRGGSEPGGDESRRNGRGAAAIGAGVDGRAATSGATRRQVALGGLDLYA